MGLKKKENKKGRTGRETSAAVTTINVLRTSEAAQKVKELANKPDA